MRNLTSSPHTMRFALGLLAVAIAAAPAADPDRAAEFAITTRLVLTNALPIGMNEFGDSGGTDYSAGNLIPDSGFEPVNIRRYWRVTNAGTHWAELDGGGMTDWDLTTSGYLSGADFRLYRIVDTNGNALPQGNGYLDLALADRFVKVCAGRVIPKGAPGFPDGGWLCTRYTQPAKVFGTRTSLSFTDAQWIENGRTYYYIVTAVSDASAYPPGTVVESDPAMSVEVSATPEASHAGGPRIYVPDGEALAEIPAARAGSSLSWTPRVVNATAPVRWSLLDAQDQPLTPPAGLSFNTNSGALSGTPTNTPDPTLLRFRVTAGNGSDTRDIFLNPPAWISSGSTNRPPPPPNVVATAGNGFVRLTWDASPSTNVVGYRVFRSVAPRSQQANRVYLDGDGPAPVKDDYLIFDRRSLVVDSSWSHPQVRDINSKVSETWNPSSSTDVFLSRELHGTNLPSEFRFPGESCLRITATNTGSRYISGPAILFPDVKGGEANWYGQLETGRTYRYEAWLRQEGLANTGRVELAFHQMYTAIKQAFLVATQWQKFAFEFTAPAPPTSGWHGMPRLNFTGPGTFWLDNIRLFRCDTPAERDLDFVPSPKVFDEMMDAQPPTGPKGMLRSMGVMLNSASMKSLLSYHRDAGATLDWYQAVSGGGNMTLPCFLEYALRTGDQPGNRMRPWLNVASFTTEEEWLALIEYLGAPINPDYPADRAAKPWAWLRYQQRGVATPWADEFERIHLEFANETWHNRASPGTLYWWGWGQYSAVHQGGLEFGLWARYVTDYIAANSPHWAARQLADKLYFVMGSNYQDYAERGRPLAPRVKAIGHAPYVGPKWETGDPPNAAFNDHGIQGTLLGWIAGTALDMDKYRTNRERLAAQGRFYEMLGYESGPSGYSLPGSAAAAQVEISEQYGKSLAMAVAALDAWLGSHEAGMSERGQLAFSQGQYWSSHTLMNDGYRRHAHWQALKLRNRFASGHMVRTRADASPTIAWNNKEWPLIGSYAFRDGAQLAVFVLSRKLGGVHDGHDFGDGSTPVTLRLPANPVGPATLYSLSGDPRTNNRTALVLTLQTQQVTMARSHTFTMPQGSIYLFITATDLPQAGTAPPTPEGFQVAFTNNAATLAWQPAEGATGYRIYRSSQAAFSLSAQPLEFTTATNAWSDEENVGGTVFYYRVAATNEFDESMPSLVALGGTNTTSPVVPAPVIQSVGEGNRCLRWDWCPVPGALGYRAGHATLPGGPYQWTDAGGQTSFIQQGFDNGQIQYLTVHAYAAGGRGPNAPEVTGTPQAPAAESVMAQWEFAPLTSYESNASATRYAVGLAVMPLLRAPGLWANTPNYHPMAGAFGFQPTTDSGNFGAAGGGSLSNALARNLFLSCTVQLEADAVLSLARLDTGAIYPYSTSPLSVQLLYRVGGGLLLAAPTHSLRVVPQTLTPTEITFDLSAIPDLQSLAVPVELRLYVFSPAADARWCRAGLQRRSGPDLVLTGIVRPARLPPMTVQSRAAQLLIAWPETGWGSHLQFATNLEAPVIWLDWPAWPVVSNGAATQALPLDGERQFFRLNYP